MRRSQKLFSAAQAAAPVAAPAAPQAKAPAVPVPASSMSPNPASAPGATAPEALNLDEGDWRPETYMVKRGDTLLGIALDYGLDYAQLHLLADFDDVRIRKVIR